MFRYSSERYSVTVNLFAPVKKPMDLKIEGWKKTCCNQIQQVN